MSTLIAVCLVGFTCFVTWYLILFLLDNVVIPPAACGALGPSLMAGSEPSLPSQSSSTPLRRVRSGRAVRTTPYMVRRLRLWAWDTVMAIGRLYVYICWLNIHIELFILVFIFKWPLFLVTFSLSGYFYAWKGRS